MLRVGGRFGGAGESRDRPLAESVHRPILRMSPASRQSEVMHQFIRAGASRHVIVATGRAPDRGGSFVRSARTTGSLITIVVLGVSIALSMGCSKNEEEWERMRSASVAEVGEPAPDFVLTDLKGVEHRLSDYISKGRVVVLEWFNPDCPYVKKHHVTYETMNEIVVAMREEKVAIFAINSAAPGMQGYGVERNQQAKDEYKMRYPILLDESGDVGRMYRAKTTPEIFLIGKDGVLIYRGAIDDEPDINVKPTVNYAKVALQQYLAGHIVSVKQTKPYGCNVKYGSRAPR